MTGLFLMIKGGRMMGFHHREIEEKWQTYWERNKTFQTETYTDKEKRYILDMFPYPSGAGLHVGHPEGYTATDIISRMSRMKGYEVMHTMGWEAFGRSEERRVGKECSVWGGRE